MQCLWLWVGYDQFKRTSLSTYSLNTTFVHTHASFYTNEEVVWCLPSCYWLGDLES